MKKFITSTALFFIFLMVFMPIVAMGVCQTSDPEQPGYCPGGGTCSGDTCEPPGGGGGGGGGGGYGGQGWVKAIMGRLIGPFAQLAGGLAVIMFIFAGILFITSNGEPGKINIAKQAVIWGVVGIVVATVAFSIDGIVKSWIS